MAFLPTKTRVELEGDWLAPRYPVDNSLLAKLKRLLTFNNVECAIERADLVSFRQNGRTFYVDSSIDAAEALVALELWIQRHK